MFTRFKFLLVFILVLTSLETLALEKPDYEVLYKEGNIEYRLYQPYVVVETTITDEERYGKAANKGFYKLFDYISGNNKANSAIEMTAPVQQKSTGEKISMTAPVQQHESKSGWTVAFMLPGNYKMGTAPTPLDSDVGLRQIPSRLMAVIRYSGRWTKKNFDKQSVILRSAVEGSGIRIMSTAESAVYNPPFVPPFMRRNEIMFEVESYPGGQALNALSSFQ